MELRNSSLIISDHLWSGRVHEEFFSYLWNDQSKVFVDVLFSVENNLEFQSL